MFEWLGGRCWGKEAVLPGNPQPILWLQAALCCHSGSRRGMPTFSSQLWWLDGTLELPVIPIHLHDSPRESQSQTGTFEWLCRSFTSSERFSSLSSLSTRSYGVKTWSQGHPLPGWSTACLAVPATLDKTRIPVTYSWDQPGNFHMNRTWPQRPRWGPEEESWEADWILPSSPVPQYPPGSTAGPTQLCSCVCVCVVCI